jgi:hypothetical protein
MSFQALMKRTLEVGHSGHVVAPVLLEFVFGSAGAAYGVGPATKISLASRFLHNTRQPGASTMFGEHVALAAALLSVPKDVRGHVAEFGCFKGWSTASLSLVCALTGRRLVIFDSFQGLPEPKEKIHGFSGKEVHYRAGEFAGSLQEVKNNVARFGDLSVCEFVPGFFADSLPGRPVDETYAMIFEDADLPASVRDVLQYAWPKLERGCRFFTQEARDREVVELFFDRSWWIQNVGEPPPGVVGSGLGLPLGRIGSGLAYATRT